MKVLLINPGDSTGEGTAYGPLTTPHMGLAYIAAYLKSKGVEVGVIEMPVYGMTYDSVATTVTTFRPNVVGISIRSFNALSGFRVARLIKKLSGSILVVAGGSHPSALPELTLRECPEIDGVVVGYGEEAMSEIVENAAATKSRDRNDVFDSVASVCYLKGDTYIENPLRPARSDLDSLPFPDYSMYDLNKFGKTYIPDGLRFQRELSIFASRGCPFKCVFCMPHGGAGLASGWNVRSPENIIAEIENNLRRFDIRSYSFNDSTFGVDKMWFTSFCRLLRERKLHKEIHWSFETRANLASIGMFQEAVDSGCRWVFFGFESGSDKVLKGARKGIARHDILMAVKSARIARVPYVSASFILGLPFETSETVKETANLIQEIKLDSVGINIVSIYPGTELLRMVQKGIGGISFAAGMSLAWDIYDRSKCHVQVNDLQPNDIEYAALQLRGAAMSNSFSQSRTRTFKRALAYLGYYALHDRGKLRHHMLQGMSGLIK